MNKNQTLNLLKGHLPELKEYGVSAIAVFGSVARGESKPDSDIDILVDFNRPVGLFQFARLKMHLESLLGKPVDLVTTTALKEQLKPSILKEAVYAW